MNYVSKDSLIDHVFAEHQSFFAVPVKGLDDGVVAKLLQFEKDKIYVRKYLALLAASDRDPNINVNTLEVPVCLQDEVVKESPPEKKATGRASKKKSQTKQRKTKVSSSTSQPASE